MDLSCWKPAWPSSTKYVGLRVASGLARTAKFLLEAEEVACRCTTVCVLLSLANIII